MKKSVYLMPTAELIGLDSQDLLTASSGYTFEEQGEGDWVVWDMKVGL